MDVPLINSPHGSNRKRISTTILTVRTIDITARVAISKTTLGTIPTTKILMGLTTILQAENLLQGAIMRTIETTTETITIEDKEKITAVAVGITLGTTQISELIALG